MITKEQDRRHYLPILSIVDENSTHKTFEFENCFGEIRAGQFLMITDYEHGEKPFSVSRVSADRVYFTIQKLGCFTSTLFDKVEGDKLSLRGPYGNGFATDGLENKSVLVLGGGCASAPLRPLCEALKASSRVTFINGARSVNEMLFVNELESFADRSYFATDDGSLGDKGNVITVCKNRVDLEEYDFIFVSGPEPMLKAALAFLESVNIPSFFLIERYMKCAVGICGQCSVDPLGIRVCVEGPVFEKAVLLQLDEFGTYKRSASGQRSYFS